MNIDNGTSKDLVEGREVTISITTTITDVGRNYIEVEAGGGLVISEGSDWFIEL